MLPRITPNDTLDRLYQAYIKALRETDFLGDIRTDYATRLTVATDNSIYQIIPQAVLFPRSTKDISIILQLGHQLAFRAVRFAARGGGTGPNGQSLSAGIIIDCSRLMRAILEINAEAMWVRVQPGVILDELNAHLKSRGFHFAPDISTSNRATIGGMVNTDACGNGSKIIGRTSDHVVGLTCVKSDGTVFDTELGLEKSAEKEITAMLAEHQNLINEKFFSAPRTLCGYNLLKAWHGQLNLNYLLCGSEGTLAVVSECKLKLSLLPKYKKLLLIRYQHFQDALRAREVTPDINPLVIETIDENLISIVRNDTIYFYIKEFIGDANAINLVEFVGNDSEEIDNQVMKLCENIQKSDDATGFYLAKNESEIKLLWDLRKKSVGLVSKRQDGTRRPIPFIEDTAVPPEKLADYIDELKALLDKYHLVYGMYGHIDAGCIHVRPALDTRLPQDEKWVRILSDEVVMLVKKYGGVMWGEHGKGFRSEYGPEFFGEVLYRVLRKIKTVFDPYNQLNPGKIATPLDSADELVKVDGPMRGHFDKTISMTMTTNYASAMACNGNGACFNYETNEVMCPSYKVMNDRMHSPKGRAVIVREWLRQLSEKQYDLSVPIIKSRFFKKIVNYFNKKLDFSNEVHLALSGCLSCKACVGQCPLNVDIPDMKSKFLSHYHTRYARSLRDYLIAHIESISRWQARFPRLSNRLFQNTLSKMILNKMTGIIDLPSVDFKNKKVSTRLPDQLKDIPENSIILLQDVFTSFYERNILINAEKLFTEMGFSVFIAPFFENGKPFHLTGFLEKFSGVVKKNVDYLRKLSEFNVPLIGLEPSITLTYRDEYQKIMAPDKTGFCVLLPQEFLKNQLAKIPRAAVKKQYYLLSHCTEKTAHVESEKEWQMIFSAAGLVLTPLAVGCCGMAGPYGHEKEHAEFSKKLFGMDWKRHLDEKPEAEKYFLATGYSCRSQTKRIAGFRLRHPLEVLLANCLEHSDTNCA